MEFSGKGRGMLEYIIVGCFPYILESPHVDLHFYHLDHMHPSKTIWGLAPHGNTRVYMGVRMGYNEPMGLLEKRIACHFCQFFFHMNEF